VSGNLKGRLRRRRMMLLMMVVEHWGVFF